MYDRALKLYGKDQKQKEHSVILENDSGSGKLTYYEITDGIILILNEMDMQYCTKDTHTEKDLVEINFCFDGRYECNIGQLCCYMTSGMLSVSRPVHTTKSACFPSGHYVGISLFLEQSVLLCSELLAFFSTDIDRIKMLTDNDSHCFIIKDNKKIKALFKKLLESVKNDDQGYMRIKAFEILCLLCRFSEKDNDSSLKYLNSRQVKTAKMVQALITQDLTKHYTLTELANYAGISETALKNNFKGIFGTSVYAYLKSMRLANAQELLCNTELTVSVIAEQIGYENPNKFSTEFKRFSGYTPREYREMCRNG
jgi:AraC-like DNA-binding protein